MAHAIVKIHPGMHFQRQQCQQQQSCRLYDIPNIPNALNMSSSSSSMSFTSSDDDDDDDGDHAVTIIPMTPSGTGGAGMGMLGSPSPENSNSAATSFMSINAIDGDYDDTETVEAVDAVGVVMPLFSGAYVVATFATAPPIDHEVVANAPVKQMRVQNNNKDHNKTKSTPTNLKPREEGAEICIICYEGIEEERGDFKRDFCDTCKYTVHNGCIDDYIVRKVRDAVRDSQISSVVIKCLMCSKQVERVILYEDNNDDDGINENNNNNNNNDDGDGLGAEQRRQIQLHQHALVIMQRRLNRGRRNRRKEIMCNICFMILIVSCGLAILLSFITKK
jgi:hypothetical protein